jgi:hypothetical protein
MKHALLVTHPSIHDAIIEQFSLAPTPIEGLGEIYANETVFLIQARNSKEDVVARYDAIQNTLHPSHTFFAFFGTSINPERREGDVILPNVFFAFDSILHTAEITKENRDSFLKNAFFLEHYDRQEDLDFTHFGLSIGGIVLSETPTLSPELATKLHIAYEADFFDDFSYALVKRSIEKGLGENFFPVGLVHAGKVNPNLKGKNKEITCSKTLGSILTYLVEKADKKKVFNFEG